MCGDEKAENSVKFRFWDKVPDFSFADAKFPL